jgi:hypothetical protein
MRKITVALEDAVYNKLIDYVVINSRRRGGRLSVSRSSSELISSALASASRQEELGVR